MAKTHRKPPAACRVTLASGSRFRRGLAPLELVLSLPLLLFVMALMINYGTAASWKVRALMVARNQAWSARWPRAGAQAQPANWPLTATRGNQQGAAVTVLADPSIDLPVARGPKIGQTTVNRNVLDPTRGLLVGTSHIQLPMPLLANMTRPILFNLTQPLLDDGFEIRTSTMNQPGPQGGQSNNGSRRETILYQFAQASNNLIQTYVNSVTAIWFSPIQNQLAVLDQDQELAAYYGSLQDFHPRLRRFCGLNVQAVHKNDVLPLIDRIKGRKKPHVAGVPERMARSFVGMYQGEIKQLQAANDPALQPQIKALQATVQTLQKFIASL
jgi:hypothetical protein